MKFRIALSAAFTLLSVVSAPCAQAATIYATGQLLVEDPDGTHNDSRQNYVYAVDTQTGIATPVSPQLTGTPAGLAGGTGGVLYGFQGGSFGVLEPSTGNFSPIGAPSDVFATGLDLIAAATPVAFNLDDASLYTIDRSTGVPTLLFAVDSPGITDPFIISLGSVGDDLYGVHLGDGENSLLRFDIAAQTTSVVGQINAVEQPGYSGFSALTGVDETGDGIYDSLFGNVNFFDHDGDPATANVRLGGIVRYDLLLGSWSLVGTNPGVIFFGMGQPVPEPASALLLGLAGLAVPAVRRYRRG